MLGKASHNMSLRPVRSFSLVILHRSRSTEIPVNLREFSLSFSNEVLKISVASKAIPTHLGDMKEDFGSLCVNPMLF